MISGCVKLKLTNANYQFLKKTFLTDMEGTVSTSFTTEDIFSTLYLKTECHLYSISSVNKNHKILIFTCILNQNC